MMKWVHNDDGWMDEEVRRSEIMRVEMIFMPGIPPDRAWDDGSSAQDDDDGWMETDG
jgi:hypothetical protein